MNTKIQIDNLIGITKILNQVEKTKKIESFDTNFSEFLQKKCIDTIKEVARQQFALIPTTNENEISAYLNGNVVKNANTKGFEICNNIKIFKPESRKSPAYEFNLSMAFEFGTGIVGANNPVIGAWQYNVGGDQNVVYINGEKVQGWWIPKDLAGRTETYGTSLSGKAIVTRGYQGLEIYRKSAVVINSRLKDWIKEYSHR